MNARIAHHIGDTLHVPLPRALWVEIEGGCKCDHCKDKPVSYWDTMALSIKPNFGKRMSHTWLVHAPEYHPK